MYAYLTKRQKLAEENYRSKFEQLGLSDRFEFIRREWSLDHDKRFWCRCKKCGAEFLSWNEVFKGRQKHLVCRQCGTASDGNDMAGRSPEMAAAMLFYQEGHSVRETSEKYSLSEYAINNYVKRHGLTNGKDWKIEGQRTNKKRSNDAADAYADYIKAGGTDYKSYSNVHRRRAVRYGSAYDSSITLKALVERDGLTCTICGGLCDWNDIDDRGIVGATYPSIDHIVPMADGGDHVWSNVRIAHKLCNSIRGRKAVI